MIPLSLTTATTTAMQHSISHTASHLVFCVSCPCLRALTPFPALSRLLSPPHYPTTTAKVRYISNLPPSLDLDRYFRYYTIVYIYRLFILIVCHYCTTLSLCVLLPLSRISTHITHAVLAYSSSCIWQIPPSPLPVLPLVMYSCN